MKFINHNNLEGLHAPFSASQPSWLNYTEDHLLEVYNNKKAAEYGTRLHEWAKETIDLRIKQPKSKNTLSMYVNDAIGYKMDTEVVLYYSEYFFGTADSICFRNNQLRIHDLKTGQGKVHIEQLKIYAALFCLEYKIKPTDISIELRIYQNDTVLVDEPTADEIMFIMDKIVKFNEILYNNQEV